MSNNVLPKVSVVVLNLNGYGDTRDCLESLKRVTYSNFDVIMVDNGSSDDSARRLSLEFPAVRILRSQRNLGFAGGNNLAIGDALQDGADYVLLLNNDTVVDPCFLSVMIEVGETEPMIGLIGPKIYYASNPKRIWYAGGRVNYDGCRHLGMDELDDETRFSRTEETGFISGCALLVKSVVLREVGLLDEKLFAYHEDTDFCLRACKAGYRCVFVGKALVWHKVSRTSGPESAFTLYLSTRNQLACVANHIALRYRPAVLAYTVAKKLAKMVSLGSRSWSSGIAVWAGIWAFVRGVYGPPQDGWMPKPQVLERPKPPDIDDDTHHEPSLRQLSSL
jgi:GT2 family glycosyltransferase